MAKNSRSVGSGTTAGSDWIISRSTRAGDDRYSLWSFDPSSKELLTFAQRGRFAATHQLAPIGGYLLEWGPLALSEYAPCFPYRLFRPDVTLADDPKSKAAVTGPLAGPTVRHGAWPKQKFWANVPDFGNPQGARKTFDVAARLMLVPLPNFLLHVIPNPGRETFQLWNFDPGTAAAPSADPLPAPYTPRGAFEAIRSTDEYLPMGNFVLTRRAKGNNSEFWLWSFDPQSCIPLARPALQRGTWPGMGAAHKLVPLGDHVLDWVPRDGTYRLWGFDPSRPDPLVGPVRSGKLPRGIDAHGTLMGFQTQVPVRIEMGATPGTMDFMRSKIKHVVYYMLENRAFDHVCGWLHDKGEKHVNYVGSREPFDGASVDMGNRVDLTSHDRVFLSKYQGGKVSDAFPLDTISQGADPYHENADVMRQLFFDDPDGYAARRTPNMEGFVWNNGTPDVMLTFSPEQLPVLNGLAKSFGVSDRWFCSVPGATDINRAFAFTGSALGQIENFQNGTTYQYWPNTNRRPSIWRVLWANGVTSWKIYNSVEWLGFVHTYHLFLQGEIPTVDANTASYVAGIDQFFADAKGGTLPAFSFLEPIWISLAGTSSYHPGESVVPGERRLAAIYDALRSSPSWDETLFVITFDEHGGLFDHVPPPYAQNPWPNDRIDGFSFDLMGPRVPTILVSPWIKEKTVFRSGGPVAYDSTSILATLLQWQGIPKGRWGLGERVRAAPTFEGVLQRGAARKDRPVFTPPHDKDYPQKGAPAEDTPLHSLHRLMAPRLVWALTGHRLSPAEATRLSDEILGSATTLRTLYEGIARAVRKVG